MKVCIEKEIFLEAIELGLKAKSSSGSKWWLEALKNVLSPDKRDISRSKYLKTLIDLRKE